MPIGSVLITRPSVLREYLSRPVFDPRQEYINYFENLLVRTLYPAG